MIAPSSSLSAAKINLRDMPIERLASADAPEADKVKELARQFETVLVKQILTEARKPVFTSKTADNSAAGGIYQGMLTDKLADSISSSGMVGFARSMEKQLIREVSTLGGSATSSTTPKAAPQPPRKIHD